MYTDAMKAGIVGCVGLHGRRAAAPARPAHPDFEVAVATAHRTPGEAVGAHTPVAGRGLPRLAYEDTRPGPSSTASTSCSARLPHGESQRLVPELPGPGRRASSTSRPTSACGTPRSTRAGTGRSTARPSCWPRPSTACPSCSGTAWPGATLVAAAGCYPTAAGLALAPAVRRRAGASRAGIVVDAASGVSGAGRGLKESLHFGTVDEDFSAYGLLTHRHTPEMEQILGAEVLFTPHLAPMVRGHPGHLLRPPRRPAARRPPRRHGPRSTTPTTTSPSWS